MSYTKTRTITYTYTVYEPGDGVVRTSARCPLASNKVYIVVDFTPPIGDETCDGTVFLEGVRYGLSAEYLTSVKKRVSG